MGSASAIIEESQNRHIWIGSDTEGLLNALRPWLDYRQAVARKMERVADQRQYLEIVNQTNDRMLEIIGISKHSDNDLDSKALK